MPNEYPKKVRIVSNLSKVKTVVTSEISLTQTLIKKLLCKFAEIINNSITKTETLKNYRNKCPPAFAKVGE